MNEEQIALARRAVACKGWRWMPGMADCWGGRVREGDGLDRSSAFPDLTDPATLGCLLALVRQAHGCSEAHVYYATVSRLWVVRWGKSGVGQWTVDSHTEVESLVAALEAAP
jgi:hypothetical protein